MQTEPLPEPLPEFLPGFLMPNATPGEAEEIARWWASLPAEVQSECLSLWDPRADDPALSRTAADGTTRWHPLPIQLLGRLVDDETRRETRMHKQQLFDYIANHEEVQFFLQERHFHICRSHPAAREVIRNGLLPATFRCPLELQGEAQGRARRDCPMRAVLVAARRQSIELSPRFVRIRVPARAGTSD